MELGLTGSAVVIRPGRRSDLDAIEDLESRVFTFNRLSRRALIHHLDNPTSVLLVATPSDRFSGYALILFRQTAAVARLYSIAVSPEARGLGRHLLAACEEASRARGFLALRLEVRTDNQAAIRLYERAHYRCFGSYSHYYADGATAFRYQRPLWRRAPKSPASPPHVEAAAGRSAEACLCMIFLWADRPPFLERLDDDCEAKTVTDILIRHGLDARAGTIDIEAIDDHRLLLVQLDREPLSRRVARRWVLVHGKLAGCVVFNDPRLAEGPVDNRPGGRDRDVADKPVSAHDGTWARSNGRDPRNEGFWIMTGWVILVDHERDFPNADTPHKVITTADYLARPKLFNGATRTKMINLSRSYNYQSKGYYASLLAEARGHRIIPTVETMLELRQQKLYEHALPDLEAALNRCAQRTRATDTGTFDLLFCFGIGQDARFETFGRLLFDWFRCPAMEVTINVMRTWKIDRVRARPLAKLGGEDTLFFRECLQRHAQRDWRNPKARAVAKYSLAVLHDPAEQLPPSNAETIRHFQKIAEKMSFDVEVISKRQLAELAEFDALFIRSTTSINNYTYRFARRALQEGMPVIDDPVSMIRSTNKVYLKELLEGQRIPIPPTVMLSENEDLDRAATQLGWPMVVKIPDGSFSRGVHRVNSRDELKTLTDQLFEDTDLLLAQKYMPTTFDWRVGVLDGEPLFVCQYHMAQGHWQIIKHGPNGNPRQGGSRTVAIADTPKDVLQTALRAARAIGCGLYGVDLKETPEGIFVIEVNDNPNLEHGIEDQVGKDEIWTRILQWFVKRIDA